MDNSILYTTVRIDVVLNDEYETIYATGTIIKLKDSDNYAIMTNAHVFLNEQKFPLKFDIAYFHVWIIDNNEVKLATFTLNGKNSNLICYYSNNDSDFIDLCGIKFNHLETDIQKYEICNSIIFDVDHIGEGMGVIPTINVGTKVLMIGYPNGKYDPKSNLPFCRTGFIASDPKLDCYGESKFLIDIKTLKGNSGSPVFVEYENDFKFIGIFSSYIKEDFILRSREVLELSLDLGFVLRPHLVNHMKNKVFGLDKALEFLTRD